jgi:hypothetical protein
LQVKSETGAGEGKTERARFVGRRMRSNRAERGRHHCRERFVFEGGLRYRVLPGGLLFCPAKKTGPSKHGCPDCHYCQWCSDDRCRICEDQGQSPILRPVRRGVLRG